MNKEDEDEVYIEMEPRRPGLRPRRIPLSSIPDVGVAPDGTGQPTVVQGGGAGEGGDDGRPPQRTYFLRKVKPLVHRYEAANMDEVRGKRRRRDDRTDYHHSPVIRRHYHNTFSTRSPAQKRQSGHRRQAHNDSSTTSSSGSGSDDERRFERRKVCAVSLGGIELGDQNNRSWSTYCKFLSLRG